MNPFSLELVSFPSVGCCEREFAIHFYRCSFALLFLQHKNSCHCGLSRWTQETFLFFINHQVLGGVGGGCSMIVVEYKSKAAYVLHHYESRKDKCHYNHRVASASLRCIDSLHAPEVADALGSVAQVLAFIINPEGGLLVTQILLQLMLCRSVWAEVPREKKKDMVPVSSQRNGHYPLSQGLPFFSIKAINSYTEGAFVEMAIHVRPEDPTLARLTLPCHVPPLPTLPMLPVHGTWGGEERRWRENNISLLFTNSWDRTLVCNLCPFLCLPFLLPVQLHILTHFILGLWI